MHVVFRPLYLHPRGNQQRLKRHALKYKCLKVTIRNNVAVIRSGERVKEKSERKDRKGVEEKEEGGRASAADAALSQRV